MAHAVGEMVAALEKHLNLTRDQALARIREDDPRMIERIRTAPPSQVTFVDLYNAWPTFAGAFCPTLGGSEASRKERTTNRASGREHRCTEVHLDVLAQSEVSGLTVGIARWLATSQFY
jgi:hypothetical protein